MALVPAINRSTTDQAFWVLLTITMPQGSDPPLRLVNNFTSVVSRGLTFQPYPFAIVLPSDAPEGQPSLTLTIDAVDQRIIEAIRGFAEAPTVKMELVLSGSPDTVDKAIDFLQLVNVTYDALTITATLQPVNFLNRPAIAAIYNGTEFPGLIW